MRALALAALALAAGCAADACAGLDGTCVALTVEGAGQVDGLRITVSGAAAGSKVVPPIAAAHALPVAVAVELAHAQSGPLHVDVTGVYLGDVVGEGATDVTITAGAHTSATVRFGSSPGGDGGAGNDGPTGGFTVTGTTVRHYVLGDGTVVDRAPDPGDGGVAALVPSGGAFTTIPGTLAADGSFTIANVPSAPYYLHFLSYWIVTSSTHVDLGQWALGRPDQKAPTAPTTLSLNVGSLAPWAANDGLELFSVNADSFILNLETVLANKPMANDTTIASSVDLHATVFGNLIDGGKGDQVMVTQLVGATSNGVPYQHVARAATLGSFTIADGSSASASGAMSNVAIDSSLPVNWARSQFAVLRGYVNPQAADDYELIDVFAQPGGLAHGSFSYAPDLALALPPAGSTDLTLSMQFGDPFPSSWTLGIATSSNFLVNYTAPGASAQGFDGAIGTQTAFIGAPPTIVPIVAPVRAPTVNGLPAFTELTGVGLTPQVAWMAPSLGAPSSYGVHVRAIVNASGATRFNYAGSVYTRDTSVTLPPGLLASGQRYFFVVTAYSEPVDFDATPLQDAYPYGYAEAPLAPVTP